MRLNIDYMDLDPLLEKLQETLPHGEKLTRTDVKQFKAIFFRLAEMISHEIAKDNNVLSKWILHSHNPSYSPFDGSPSVLYRCSNCGYVTGNQTDYCPACGRKLTKR